jgi:hypothetical protein
MKKLNHIKNNRLITYRYKEQQVKYNLINKKKTTQRM